MPEPHTKQVIAERCDQRRSLETEVARLRTAIGDALAALRSGYRSPHPLDFYRGADPAMHDYVEGGDAARAAKLLDDALAGPGGEGEGRRPMADDQHTTPAQREALRRRYLAPPAVTMPCPTCGAAMVLAMPERHAIGITWTWRCSRSPAHWPVRHIDHYGDLDVIAAVDDADALARERGRVAELERALREIRSEAVYGLERQRLAGVTLTIEGIARRALGLPMAPWTLPADAPGRGREGDE